jgi:hypothetical protein
MDENRTLKPIEIVLIREKGCGRGKKGVKLIKLHM